VKLTANKIAGMLRQRGYRLTPQRHAVLKAIAATQDSLTTAAIYEHARNIHLKIGLVTIYRTINILSKLQLICQINTRGHSKKYLMRRPIGHHHHLVCLVCGRAMDFSDCDLSDLEQKIMKETGFEIEGHALELYGRCPSCL
jgi:Fe2+ or Zn2+ uptake regulation protein